MLIGFVRCHLSTDSSSGFQDMLFGKECEVFLWGKQACPSCLIQNCSLRHFDFPEPLHVQIILQLYIYICSYTLEVRGQCSVISLITFHLYFEISSLSLATGTELYSPTCLYISSNSRRGLRDARCHVQLSQNTTQLCVRVYSVCPEARRGCHIPWSQGYKCELLENVLEIKLGPNSPGLTSSFLGECWGLTQTQAAWLVWKEGTLLSRPQPQCPRRRDVWSFGSPSVLLIFFSSLFTLDFCEQAAVTFGNSHLPWFFYIPVSDRAVRI